MTEVLANGTWPLVVPESRAARWDADWEAPRLADMAEHLGPGDTIVDVGAELGDLSALYATWGCATVLLEPNPLLWPSIRTTYAVNDLPAPLAWWVGFASDITYRPHHARIAEPFGTDGWPTCAGGDEIPTEYGFAHLSQQYDVIDQVTLDDLCDRAGVAPTAVTIDCEGSELRVLNGAARILTEHRPRVWVSVHSDREWMDSQYGGVGAHDVYVYMARFGYEPTELALDHELHVRMDPT